MDIGAVITELREERRWSMGQLALHAGVSKATISFIESGRTAVPAADTVAKLAGALEVSCDYLCEQAGWYNSKKRAILPPEVEELARVIDAYPDGPAKVQARKMVIDMAVILQTLRERMEQMPSDGDDQGTDV